MLLEEIRQKIVDYGNQLILSGLTIGTAGNISMYDPETGYMAISPSGIPYAQTTAEDVVAMDLQGNIVDGKRKPSSENGLHAAFYLEKPEARAVVHAHSMYCTTLACAGVDLKATHYAIADTGVATVPTDSIFHLWYTGACRRRARMPASYRQQGTSHGKSWYGCLW